MNKKVLISFVFSFRNEQENILELVSRVSKTIDLIQNCDYEMIFVNDASTDNSLSILLKLQKKFPITIINMSRNFGVTPCVLAGFQSSKGDAVIYMDSDLQDPPELAKDLISSFRNGNDVVHTTRLKREGEGLIKLWLTKKAYNIINYFSSLYLPENTGDFKLISKRAVKHILSLKEYDPYMRGLSIWVGFKQDFIKYNRDSRFSGETKFPLFSKNPINEFIRGLTSYSAAPLYVSLIVGFFTLIICILLMLFAFFSKMMGLSAPGSSGILIFMALFNAIILITNGLMGVYIARIYYEVKERPRYIISDIIKPTKNAT